MLSIARTAALALGAAALLVAAEAEYEKLATSHDLMEVVVKPNMDALAAIRKQGGPADDKAWKSANAAASILGESGHLLLMGGRVKDDAWREGAEALLAGSKAAMQASLRRDLEGWNAAMGQIGGGCRSCHEVHRPKKDQKKVGE